MPSLLLLLPTKLRRRAGHVAYNGPCIVSSRQPMKAGPVHGVKLWASANEKSILGATAYLGARVVTLDRYWQHRAESSDVDLEE